jgi:hypothetical protein
MIIQESQWRYCKSALVNDIFDSNVTSDYVFNFDPDDYDAGPTEWSSEGKDWYYMVCDILEDYIVSIKNSINEIDNKIKPIQFYKICKISDAHLARNKFDELKQIFDNYFIIGERINDLESFYKQYLGRNTKESPIEIDFKLCTTVDRQAHEIEQSISEINNLLDKIDF